MSLRKDQGKETKEKKSGFFKRSFRRKSNKTDGSTTSSVGGGGSSSQQSGDVTPTATLEFKPTATGGSLWEEVLNELPTLAANATDTGPSVNVIRLEEDAKLEEEVRMESEKITKEITEKVHVPTAPMATPEAVSEGVPDDSLLLMLPLQLNVVTAAGKDLEEEAIDHSSKLNAKREIVIVKERAVSVSVHCGIARHQYEYHRATQSPSGENPRVHQAESEYEEKDWDLRNYGHAIAVDRLKLIHQEEQEAASRTNFAFSNLSLQEQQRFRPIIDSSTWFYYDQMEEEIPPREEDEQQIVRNLKGGEEEVEEEGREADDEEEGMFGDPEDILLLTGQSASVSQGVTTGRMATVEILVNTSDDQHVTVGYREEHPLRGNTDFITIYRSDGIIMQQEPTEENFSLVEDSIDAALKLEEDNANNLDVNVEGETIELQTSAESNVNHFLSVQQIDQDNSHRNVVAIEMLSASSQECHSSSVTNVTSHPSLQSLSAAEDNKVFLSDLLLESETEKLLTQDVEEVKMSISNSSDDSDYVQVGNFQEDRESVRTLEDWIVIEGEKNQIVHREVSVEEAKLLMEPVLLDIIHKPIKQQMLSVLEDISCVDKAVVKESGVHTTRAEMRIILNEMPQSVLIGPCQVKSLQLSEEEKTNNTWVEESSTSVTSTKTISTVVSTYASSTTTRNAEEDFGSGKKDMMEEATDAKEELDGKIVEKTIVGEQRIQPEPTSFINEIYFQFGSNNDSSATTESSLISQTHEETSTSNQFQSDIIREENRTVAMEEPMILLAQQIQEGERSHQEDAAEDYSNNLIHHSSSTTQEHATNTTVFKSEFFMSFTGEPESEIPPFLVDQSSTKLMKSAEVTIEDVAAAAESVETVGEHTKSTVFKSEFFMSFSGAPESEIHSASVDQSSTMLLNPTAEVTIANAVSAEESLEKAGEEHTISTMFKSELFMSFSETSESEISTVSVDQSAVVSRQSAEVTIQEESLEKFGEHLAQSIIQQSVGESFEIVEKSEILLKNEIIQENQSEKNDTLAPLSSSTNQQQQYLESSLTDETFMASFEIIPEFTSGHLQESSDEEYHSTEDMEMLEKEENNDYIEAINEAKSLMEPVLREIIFHQSKEHMDLVLRDVETHKLRQNMEPVLSEIIRRSSKQKMSEVLESLRLREAKQKMNTILDEVLLYSTKRQMKGVLEEVRLQKAKVLMKSVLLDIIKASQKEDENLAPPTSGNSIEVQQQPEPTSKVEEEVEQEEEEEWHSAREESVKITTTRTKTLITSSTKSLSQTKEEAEREKHVGALANLKMTLHTYSTKGFVSKQIWVKKFKNPGDLENFDKILEEKEFLLDRVNICGHYVYIYARLHKRATNFVKNDSVDVVQWSVHKLSNSPYLHYSHDNWKTKETIAMHFVDYLTVSGHHLYRAQLELSQLSHALDKLELQMHVNVGSTHRQLKDGGYVLRKVPTRMWKKHFLLPLFVNPLDSHSHFHDHVEKSKCCLSHVNVDDEHNSLKVWIQTVSSQGDDVCRLLYSNDQWSQHRESLVLKRVDHLQNSNQNIYEAQLDVRQVTDTLSLLIAYINGVTGEEILDTRGTFGCYAFTRISLTDSTKLSTEVTTEEEVPYVEPSSQHVFTCQEEMIETKQVEIAPAEDEDECSASGWIRARRFTEPALKSVESVQPPRRKRRGSHDLQPHDSLPDGLIEEYSQSHSVSHESVKEISARVSPGTSELNLDDDSELIWKADFTNPGDNPEDFQHRLQEQKISLERVVITSNTVRVIVRSTKALSSDESLYVRLSHDEWEHHIDLATSTQPTEDNYHTHCVDLVLSKEARSIDFVIRLTNNETDVFDSYAAGHSYKLIKVAQTDRNWVVPEIHIQLETSRGNEDSNNRSNTTTTYVTARQNNTDDEEDFHSLAPTDADFDSQILSTEEDVKQPIDSDHNEEARRDSDASTTCENELEIDRGSDEEDKDSENTVESSSEVLEGTVVTKTTTRKITKNVLKTTNNFLPTTRNAFKTFSLESKWSMVLYWVTKYQEQLILSPSFEQPSDQTNYFVEVRRNRILLDRLIVRGHNVVVYASCFDPDTSIQPSHDLTIFLCYTVNQWASHHELELSYLHTMKQHEIHVFAAKLTLSKHLQELQFVLRLHRNDNGAEYWDNGMQSSPYTVQLSSFQTNTWHASPNRLIPLFKNPQGESLILSRLKESGVVLSHVTLQSNYVLTFWIRSSFNDSRVFVHYSFDEWSQHNTVECQYVDEFVPGESSLFSCTVDARPQLDNAEGKRSLVFVIESVKDDDASYWDTNDTEEAYLFITMATSDLLEKTVQEQGDDSSISITNTKYNQMRQITLLKRQHIQQFLETVETNISREVNVDETSSSTAWWYRIITNLQSLTTTHWKKQFVNPEIALGFSYFHQVHNNGIKLGHVIVSNTSCRLAVNVQPANNIKKVLVEWKYTEGHSHDSELDAWHSVEMQHFDRDDRHNTYLFVSQLHLESHSGKCLYMRFVLVKEEEEANAPSVRVVDDNNGQNYIFKAAHISKCKHRWLTLFPAPVLSSHFLTRLDTQQVCLERVSSLGNVVYFFVRAKDAYLREQTVVEQCPGLMIRLSSSQGGFTYRLPLRPFVHWSDRQETVLMACWNSRGEEPLVDVAIEKLGQAQLLDKGDPVGGYRIISSTSLWGKANMGKMLFIADPQASVSVQSSWNVTSKGTVALRVNVPSLKVDSLTVLKLDNAGWTTVQPLLEPESAAQNALNISQTNLFPTDALPMSVHLRIVSSDSDVRVLLLNNQLASCQMD